MTEGVIKEGGERRSGYMFHPKGGGAPQKLDVPEPKITVADAFPAFINACRTRKPEDNNCDAEVAHYSAACCHLGNISYRLGTADPKNYSKADELVKKESKNNSEVVGALEKIRDNCKAYGIPMDEASWVIGPVLTFDPKTERFNGERAEDANKLLRRDYRAPFVVPETV
jgi:hypothetical protein